MGVSLTPRELDVMAILWRLGEGSVRDVRDRLDETLAYTSVLSVLQLLEQKGHVGHRKEGRAYRYFPLIEPEEAGETVLERMLGTVYGNSPVRLVAHLVESRTLSDEDVERIRTLLDDQGTDPPGDGTAKGGSGGSGTPDEDDRDDDGEGRA